MWRRCVQIAMTYQLARRRILPLKERTLFALSELVPLLWELASCMLRDICAAGETHVKLCQTCSDSCGILDEEFTVPVDSLGDLPFGTVFPRQSNLQCRSNVCVPGHVADPKALCRVVADEALLYHTRRLLSVSAFHPVQCSLMVPERLYEASRPTASSLSTI